MSNYWLEQMLELGFVEFMMRTDGRAWFVVAKSKDHKRLAAGGSSDRDQALKACLSEARKL